MGRKNKIKSIITDAFIKTNAKTYKCKFCDHSYVLNVTRMSQHLVQKCMHCPPAIKQAIIKDTKAHDMKKKKEKKSYCKYIRFVLLEWYYLLIHILVFKKRDNMEKTEFDITDTDSNEEPENDSDSPNDVEKTSDLEHLVENRDLNQRKKYKRSSSSIVSSSRTSATVSTTLDSFVDSIFPSEEVSF